MVKFSSLNISHKTLAGLSKENYVEMTEIQHAAIPVALKGNDVLGAAKTGSGKTIAFLIPMLELLARESWTLHDGLGALVITPTRELALQIFEVLRKIGHQHTFSAGLIIGGKKLKEEQEKIIRMNILICTPGRLLQHMDQTPGFDMGNLKLLILDEADRILDMGFKNTINAIIDHLPQERQTLLFSATQTSSVEDLTRLSLSTPTHIQVLQDDESATPSQLQQYYMSCPLGSKLDWLYSFIRSHLQTKTLVFVSSCKETRFLFEALCKLQPGIPLLHLHGKQNQLKRFGIFSEFCKRPSALLIATDIAARGLDFPSIDWVIQFDCPDSVESYIHRVGRTARYESKGNGLLFLLPSEESGMLELLEEKKIPISKIEPNLNKLVSIQPQLIAICSQYPNIKYLAQKIFDVSQLNIEDLATSYGLSSAPHLKFIKKCNKKNEIRDLINNAQSKIPERESRLKKESSTMEQQPVKLFDSEDGGDLLTVKQNARHLEEDMSETLPVQKKIKRKKEAASTISNSRFVYDDEGNIKPSYEFKSESAFRGKDLKQEATAYLSESKKKLEAVDQMDREVDKLKRKTKRQEKQQKEKLQMHD